MAKNDFLKEMASVMGKGFDASSSKVIPINADFPPLGSSAPIKKGSVACSSMAMPIDSVLPPSGSSEPGKKGSIQGSASTWHSLFVPDSKAKLQFFQPKIIEGEKFVCIPKEVCDQGLSIWNDNLIGQFFGSPAIN